MARKSKQSILKRQRELKKAEKQALKRERREAREAASAESDGISVATKEDLEGYGFPSDEPQEEAPKG